MKKLLLSIFTAISLVIPLGIFGQTTIIGAGSATGTSSNIGPIYRSSAASAFDFSQQFYLYTQTELAAAGINPGDFINSVAFFKDNGFGTVATNNVSIWRIYMKNSAATPSSTWSSGNFATQSTGATLVYDNPAQVIPTATGFITLTFGSPFMYTGGSLEIGSYWDCSAFVGNPTDGAFSWKRDPLTNQVFGGSNSTSTITMTLQTGRPQIQIGYTPGTPCVAPPTAGTVSTISNICPNVNFSVALSGNTYGAGQTYQWQSSTTGAVGSFTNIAGATNSSASVNQMVSTYYRCVATCSGMSDTTAAVLVTANNFMSCYCTSNATNTADDDIGQITLGTFANPATAPTPLTSNATSTNTYTNNSAVDTIDLLLGASYPFTVTQINSSTSYYQCDFGVYIDYNHDGDFNDVGESVVGVGPAANPGVGPHWSTTINVPLTATTGLTRMRVVQNETGTTNPCGTYSWGETEDYTINILCPTFTGTGAVDQGICSGTAATFTGTPSYSGATISWWDSASGGTQLGTGNSFTTPTLTSTTTYYVQEDYTGCPSSTRADIDAIVTAVAVTLVPVNVTCNGMANGSFTQTAISCGTAPFQYSLDQVTWGPIPTNLVAGTYFFYVQDAIGGVSAPIQVIITQPSAPQNLNAFNINYFNGMATWTPQGNETSWNVEYGPAGFTPGTGTTIVATNDTVTISGLTENTDYDFYVQAGCIATSDWAGPYSFSTDPGFLAWDNECPTTGFVDISGTGTDLNLTDDSETGITLPFAFTYQGGSVTNLTVGNNGGIQLNTLTGNVGYGGNMTTITGDYLFAWGDDMDDETGNVYYQVTGTAPNQVAIFQWNNSNNFSNGAGTVTFQIQLYEATGEIYYVYDDAVFGGSETADDYAGNADIGLSGPTTDLNVSNNNQAYLQNNSCVHFYYALCPNVQNMVTITYADDAQLNWDPGLYGETNWTVIYGLDGFDPTVPGQAIDTFTVTSSQVDFGAQLTQLTCYDAYIYSECQADNLTSEGYLVNFCTKPYCADITSLAGTTDPDSLELTWNWIQSSPVYPVTGFNVQYGMTGFTLGSGTIVPATGIDFSDTIPDANLMGSGVYQVYVQAECSATNDTSNWVGPITVVMPVTNDIVCDQEALMLDTDYTFNTTGATVSLNETNIAPPATGTQTTDGWVNSTLNGTLWYSFTAPATGQVRINGTAINFNSQAAVYSAINCADFNTFTLLAANDDAIGGTSVSPNFTICDLTPGNTYYLMVDKFSNTNGNFAVRISEVILEAGMANPITNICYGTNIDLFTTITGNNPGGTWSSAIPSVNASITGSDFESNGLAYTTFDFEYRVVDGCAYDSIISQVKVFAPSNAGEDGTILACRNEPIDLLAGLNGNADLNGDWYDPSDVLLPNSQVTTANFPGQYNYDYISGNGVCPDDTANVVVTVNPNNCNFLSVEENALEEIALYPNPSTGVVFIESTFTGNFDLTVTDINGRTIQTGTNVTSGKNTVNLKEVERGTYFFKLSTENAEKVFRVVIQ